MMYKKVINRVNYKSFHHKEKNSISLILYLSEMMYVH